MAKSNTIRKNFSISRKFLEVDEILASLPESDQSRFICEAILHYNEFKNNPNWLLQQVAPIVQMQQQLSALYPNQGVGNVAQQSTSPAPKELPSHHDTRNQFSSQRNEIENKVKSNEEISQNKIKETLDTKKEIVETDSEHTKEKVKAVSEEVPIKEKDNVEKPTSTPRAPRRRSGLSSQFDQ